MEDTNARLTELLSQASVKLHERNWSELHQLFEQMYALTLEEDLQKQRDGQAMLAAETAVQDGHWQWGRQLYQLILSYTSGHQGASIGLREIAEFERVDEEMRRLIEAGDEAFTTGDYRQAIDRYKDAKNQTEKARIFKYHASLEQKINQALELRSWQERVQATVAQARRLRKEGELTKTLAELQRLQAEMPEEPLYAGMAQEISALISQIKQETDAGEILSEAKKRYQEDDFEGALELVDIPALAANEEANRLKQRCRDQLDRFIHPVLDRSEQALLRNQWLDAFAELQGLRKDYPRNPNWKRFWLRVGRKAGEQALDQGRQANGDRNFQEARASFDRARQAFDRVLEVYPEHTAIPALRDEAVDLSYIADNEHQAMKLWRQGERKTALTHLDNARGRISSAREQGREYAAVDSVVEAMVKAIQGELESIAEDERRLENGERQLANQQFDSASHSFNQALNALLPEHRQRARNGLDRAEAAIHDFNASISQAKGSADPEGRVRYLEEAYRLWPTGPQAVELLATACLEAAEAALEEGRAQDAAMFAHRALELDPGNRAAEAIRDRIDNEPKILADLTHARSELDLLRGAIDASAERYAALASQLQETAARARPYPDLKKQTDALLKEARAGQTRWQQVERQLAQATENMHAGRWEEGITLLANAVKALGEEAPEPLATRLQAWQRAQNQCQEIETQLDDLWRQAEESYRASPESNDFAAALKNLEQIETRLSAVESTANTIEANLPASLVEQQKQFKELHERAKTAHEAAAQRSAVQGLLILRQARHKWPMDATLQQLEAKLSEQARDEVASLLRQAQLDMDAGNTDEAVEKLTQAYKLQPDNEEIATLYGAAQKQKKLEDKLRDVQTLAAAKLEGRSRVEAANALRNGIQILLREANLGDEARNIVGSLFTLSETTREDNPGAAFASNEVWNRALTLRRELANLANQGWDHEQLSGLVDQWSGLIRDQHLHGYQSTQAAVGQYFQSWRAATDAMMRQPGDLEIQAVVVERLSQFIKQCEIAATKRIKNARIFLEKGDFILARDELDSLQTVIGPALEISPNFFEANEALAVHAEIEKVQALRQEIVTQAAVAEKAMPLLEKAEADYVVGNYEEASRNLRALPDLASVPRLAAQRDDLQKRLRQARVAQAERMLSEALLVAITNLNLATSEEDLKSITTTLRAVGEAPTFDWSILPGEERSRYDELLRKIDRRQADFSSVKTFLESADTKERAGQFEETKQLLEKARELTADHSEQTRIDLRLRNITKLAGLEADARDLLKKGEDKLAQAEPPYQDILTLLGSVQNRFSALKREIKVNLEEAQAEPASDAVHTQEERIVALINVAQAGVALARAEAHRERPDSWAAARYGCEDALEFAKEASNSNDGNVKIKARVIERRAKHLLGQIEKEQAASAKLRVELGAVETWLMAGNLEDARRRLDELTEQATGSSEQIEQIKTRYLAILNVTEQTKKARAAMGAGDYPTALATVNIVLSSVPDFQDALILKQQIEQGAEANKRLQEALSHARQEKFQEARSALQRAVESGVDEARRNEVENDIDFMEQMAKNRAVEPIRTSIKVGEYRKAVDECRKALARLVSSGFKEEIEALQADAMDKWIKSELWGRAYNDTGKELDDLLETLKLYSERTPPLGEAQHRTLLNLQREARTRQLEAQLAQARELVESDKPNWDEARRLVAEVIDASGKYGLGGVQRDAVSLEYNIDDLQRAWNKTQTQSTRDKLIDKAQKRWNSAAGPEDYQEVENLAQQALGLEGFRTDREARKWQQDARRELEAYQHTEQSMAEASELVRQRRFKEARAALQIAPVAMLLQEQHQRRRQLVDALIEADGAEIEGEWQAALDGYRRVLEIDRNLELVLQVDIDRCRSKLMDAVSEQVQTALTAVPPNTQRAAQLLDQAEANELVGDADRQVVQRLRIRIEGLTQVAQAAALLTEPSGDAGEALRLLAAARDILPAGEADRLVRNWEYLAAALQGWQRGEIDAAQHAVNAIQPPVSALPRVTQLADNLDKAARRSQQIDQANRQVLSALRQDPPAFAEAVALVASLAREIEDSRVENLRATVRRRLLDQVEYERQRDNYQTALDLQPLLEQLNPTALETRSLAETLSLEREQRLQETMDAALAALAVNDLDQAQRSYQRATVIAAPAGDSRLASVAQRIADHENLLQRIDELTAGAAQARRSGQWDKAVGLLEEAREIASRQKQVQESCQDTQRQLIGLAEDNLRAGRFEDAAGRVALASRLGATPELQALAERIESARQAHVGQRREQFSAALDRWDLAAAGMLAAELQGAIGSDVKLKQLRDRYLAMQEASKQIVQTMRNAWAALDQRQFLQARSALQQANALINPSGFAEAGAWLTYATNLEAAAEPVTQGRWKALRSAQEALQRAKVAVDSSDPAALPAILPEVANRRRNATATVAELERILAQIMQWYQRYEERARELRTGEAIDALNQVDHYQQEFLRQFGDPTPPRASAGYDAVERTTATRPAGRSAVQPVQVGAAAREPIQDADQRQAEDPAAAVRPEADAKSARSDETAAELPQDTNGTTAQRVAKPAVRPYNEPAAHTTPAEHTDPVIPTAKEPAPIAPPQKRSPTTEPLTQASDDADARRGETADEPASSDSAEEESNGDGGLTMVWDMTGFTLTSYDDKE